MTSPTSAGGARQTFGLGPCGELRAGFHTGQVAKSGHSPQSNGNPPALLIERFNIKMIAYPPRPRFNSAHAKRSVYP
jgi:hypothetical protein